MYQRILLLVSRNLFYVIYQQYSLARMNIFSWKMIAKFEEMGDLMTCKGFESFNIGWKGKGLIICKL